MFFAGETALLAAQAVIFVGEVEPVHAVAVRRVDVVSDAGVDANTVLNIQVIYVGVLGECSVFDFEVERDVPLTRRLLFQRDFFDAGVVGNGAVIANGDVTDFRSRAWQSDHSCFWSSKPDCEYVTLWYSRGDFHLSHPTL